MSFRSVLMVDPCRRLWVVGLGKSRSILSAAPEWPLSRDYRKRLRSERNGVSQAPPSGSESRLMRGSGSRNTPGISSRSTNSNSPDVNAQLACSRELMTVTGMPRRRSRPADRERPDRRPTPPRDQLDPQSACEGRCGRACRAHVAVIGEFRLREHRVPDVAQGIHPSGGRHRRYLGRCW